MTGFSQKRLAGCKRMNLQKSRNACATKTLLVNCKKSKSNLDKESHRWKVTAFLGHIKEQCNWRTPAKRTATAVVLAAYGEEVGI